MILESIKKYITHTLNESIESLSDDILGNKNKQEVIKLVKDGLLGYAVELWSSVDLENEIFGKDIVKYLFDIDKENFRYCDFNEGCKLYYCLSDYELPKHIKILKELDDKSNGESNLCQEFLFQLNNIGIVFFKMNDNNQNLGELLLEDEHKQYMKDILSLLKPNKYIFDDFRKVFDEEMMNEFILLEDEIDHAFDQFIKMVRSRLSRMEIDNNTIAINQGSLFFCDAKDTNYNNIYDFYETNLNIPIIMANSFIYNSKLIKNTINIKIEKLEFWEEIYGQWVYDTEQALNGVFDSRARVNYSEYKNNEKLIEKGYYDNKPNIRVISSDMGKVFVAGLYNAFYEANLERKAYHNNEKNFFNNQNELIRFVEKIWLQNLDSFIMATENYNKVIKEYIMRRLCYKNGIHYEEFMAYKNSELAKKFICDYKQKVHEKIEKQKLNLERKESLIINKISDISNKAIEIQKDIDDIGFVLFGEKAEKKRNLKRILNELKKEKTKNVEHLKSLSNEMDEISGFVKAGCVYRDRYETGEIIADLTEIYVLCQKEKRVYSVCTKKENLLIGDMGIDFNIIAGNLDRKFYGVIDYLDDWRSDELVLVVNILKEEI